MMNVEKGDVVVVKGKLKDVVDFLAKADKETMRILASFFQDEAKGTTDAKRLTKPMPITNVYKDSIEVKISSQYVWEEKPDYFAIYEDEDA